MHAYTLYLLSITGPLKILMQLKLLQSVKANISRQYNIIIYFGTFDSKAYVFKVTIIPVHYTKLIGCDALMPIL